MSIRGSILWLRVGISTMLTIVRWGIALKNGSNIELNGGSFLNLLGDGPMLLLFIWKLSSLMPSLTRVHATTVLVKYAAYLECIFILFYWVGFLSTFLACYQYCILRLARDLTCSQIFKTSLAWWCQCHVLVLFREVFQHPGRPSTLFN